VNQQPTLDTPRLTLRPFAATDAPMVQRLAGARAVADTALNIPHPYPDGAAESFIAFTHAEYDAGDGATFAIVERDSGELVGACGIRITLRFAHAEMGYWIAEHAWGRGYATEAAGAVLRYAFTQRGLHRVFAHHLTRNPSSGRVLQKLGMRREGLLRGHVLKGDVFEDVEIYGVLAEEFTP
jgi:RimJ/RimL family protein N-acetyltransferase